MSWYRVLTPVLALALCLAASLPAQDKKEDTKKDEVKKDEPKKDEPKKDDPKNDTPKKNTPKKDTPKKDEPKKDEPVGPPAWKFDKPFAQTWETKVKQKVTVSKGKEGTEGKPAVYDSAVLIKVSWTPEPPAKQGKAKDQRFSLKIASIKATVMAPGLEEPLVIEAGKETAKLPVAALVKALDQAPLKVTLELASMKAKVSGLEEVLKTLSEKDRKAVELFMDAELLDRQVEAAFFPLPAKKGDPATKSPTRKFAAGKLGTCETSTLYTFQDVKDRVVTYRTQSQWAFAPSGERLNGVKVAKIDPNQVTLQGVNTFDLRTGLLQQASLKGTNLKQTYSVTAGSESMTVKVVLDYESTISAVVEAE